MQARDLFDDPERLAKGLEDRADVTGSYDHLLWEIARKNKLQTLFNEGQTDLTDYGFDIEYYGSAEPKTSFQPSKTYQTHFKPTRGDFMATEHNKLDVDVQNRPQNTSKSAEVTGIRTGERQEFYDPNEDGEYEYGSAEDRMVQLTLTYEHDGVELQETETFRHYSNPHPRSTLAKIKDRYGDIEKGLEVNLDFDSDGYGSIVLP